MKTQADLERIFRRQFLPPPSIVWWKWARDGGIILGPRVPTAHHGPYDLLRTPALIGIADMIDDPETVMFAAKKGAQIGLTQLVLCWIASRTKFNPGPTMIVAANEKLAKMRSRNTLKPIFEDSPELATEIKPGRESWTDLEYQFIRSHLYWFGGNSPKGLASNPMRDLYIDEENKFDNALDEGDNVELAIERTKSFKYSKKIIRTCTPTTQDGRISLVYEKGDRRRFHVPCPHCGHRQHLRWEQVKDKDGRDWKELEHQDAAESARYFCESCAKPWTDLERIDAIESASKLPDRGWIATAKAKERGLVTAHMPSLISGFVSMSDMVAKFLNAKDVPSELRNFVNSWLAEDWKPERKAAKSTTLDNCKAGYTWGTSPESDPVIKALTDGLEFRIFTHGDVQKNGIWAWSQIYWQTGHSALLSFQFVGGYKELEEFSQKEWDIAGKKWHSHFISIDSGDGTRTKEIYDQCYAYNWFAIKGANRSLQMLFEYKEWNLETGRTGGSGLVIPGLYIDTATIKHNLIQIFDKTQKMTKEEFDAGERPIGPQFWIPSDIPETVPRQLTSEEFNNAEGLWELKKGRAGSDGNHLLDCAVNVYGMAVFNQLCFREIQ